MSASLCNALAHRHSHTVKHKRFYQLSYRYLEYIFNSQRSVTSNDKRSNGSILVKDKTNHRDMGRAKNECERKEEQAASMQNGFK